MVYFGTYSFFDKMDVRFVISGGSENTQILRFWKIEIFCKKVYTYDSNTEFYLKFLPRLALFLARFQERKKVKANHIIYENKKIIPEFRSRQFGSSKMFLIQQHQCVLPQASNNNYERKLLKKRPQDQKY